jgi:hypothetical protein
MSFNNDIFPLKHKTRLNVEATKRRMSIEKNIHRESSP